MATTSDTSAPAYNVDDWKLLNELALACKGDIAKLYPALKNEQALKQILHLIGIAPVVISSLAATETALRTSRQSAENFAAKYDKVSATSAQLEIDNLDAQLQLEQANTEINGLRGQVQLLREMRASGELERMAAEQPRRSPAHPDAEMFTGLVKDKSLLTTWLKDIHMKLLRNADWFPTEQDKMCHMVARLSHDARKQIDSGVGEDGVVTFASTAEIVTILKNAFGNVNERQDAEQDILVMVAKKNEPFIDFFPRWSAVINLTTFNDAAKIALLWKILPIPIRTRLNGEKNLTDKFDEYCTLVRDFDGQLRHADSKGYAAVSTGPLNVSSTMITPPLTSSPVPLGDPMDLSALSWTVGTKPVGDLQKAERRKYCINNDLCLWCAKPGHRVTDCAETPSNKKKAEEKKKAEGKA